MEDIRAQVIQLQQFWKKVYQTIQANPAIYAPYLPLGAPEQINGVVETIAYWVGRTRAPKGFSPAFRVARGLVATSVSGALASAQALSRGEYGHFPAFTAALNQALSGLHSAIVFSGKAEGSSAVADLASALAETMSLLEDARKELAGKAAQLQQSDEVVDRIEKAAVEVEASSGRVSDALEYIEEKQKGVVSAAEAVTGHAEEIAESKSELEQLIKQSKELENRLKESEKVIQDISETATKQAKLIADLLPKGASAGLASAFGARVTQLENSKRVWMLIFMVSIASLAAIAFWSFIHPVQSTEELWRQLIHRLPVAAPLVWLGWFSAIQYGNTIRVQEDYAFKEATSKAFAGYRDHMEHMASVELSEANNAMRLLAARTIEILAREPLRVYQGSDKDASPSHSLFGAISALRNGRAARANPTED